MNVTGHHGEIQENGTTAQILCAPAPPCTRSLLAVIAPAAPSRATTAWPRCATCKRRWA
jgi:ABC-type glutathione transport system ATPase component